MNKEKKDFFRGKSYNKRKKILFYLIILPFFSFFLANCTYRPTSLPKESFPYKPEYHILKKGETLWRISKMYNVPLEDIIQYNNIDDVTDIPTGTKIYFPSRTRRRREHAPVFQWPLKGHISRGFKINGPVHHRGIDILASKGTPIDAAAPGRVIYSGSKISGYGNILIIKHSSGFSTVYAHNMINLVKLGEMVDAGQLIARVGNTGRSTGPHLHFEIRKNEKPVDPRLYLPNL